MQQTDSVACWLLALRCRRLRCACPRKRAAPAGTTVTAVADEGRRLERVASAADRNRIARTALAWQTGLPKRARADFGDAIRGEGKLLVRGGGAGRGRRRRRAATAAGWSRSAAPRRGPAFERFKPFFCYVEVEGDLFTIVKQTGSQRPAGRLVGGR